MLIDYDCNENNGSGVFTLRASKRGTFDGETDVDASDYFHLTYRAAETVQNAVIEGASVFFATIHLFDYSPHKHNGARKVPS